MKWNKLPEKEPPFGFKLLVWDKNLTTWVAASLDEIKHRQNGVEYIFRDSNGEIIESVITHWVVPTKPKD